MASLKFGPFAAPGVVQATPADHPRYTTAHLVAFKDDTDHRHSVITAFGHTQPLENFCADPQCTDYHRADFPQDRPHYHIGRKAIAIVSAVFAEANSERKP